MAIATTTPLNVAFESASSIRSVLDEGKERGLEPLVKLESGVELEKVKAEELEKANEGLADENGDLNL